MRPHCLNKQSILIGGFAAAALILTAACYWPSLSGPFIFDDIPNLQPLARSGGLTSTDSWLRFVGSNESGSLGRPISMLSFALNAQNWPTDPRPFRLTNLLIHLVCGVLVFAFCRRLFTLKYESSLSAWLALGCGAIWLTHPLLVSTTAYVIQRMTQLSCLFTLLGLLCYLRGRLQLKTEARLGWLWVLIGMGLFGSLAILSKENGVLLPLYALIIELSLFGGSAYKIGQHRTALIIVLLSPILLLIGYLSLHLPSLHTALPGRDFTLSQRLLTQTAVLSDYLRLSLLPQMSGLGVIQDGYPISQGLLNPVKTAICLTLLIGLFTLAILLGRKLIFLCLGILWFFAGHSLESGPISLELYFEHRNYLPLLGIVIAIVGSLPALPKRIQQAAPIALLGFIALCSFMTWQSAKLWGDETLLIHVNAEEHPNSARAQMALLNLTTKQREWQKALVLATELNARFPEHGTIGLQRLTLECQTGNITPASLQRSQSLVRHANFDPALPDTLHYLTQAIISGQCEGIDLQDNLALLDAALANPVTTRRRDFLGAIQYYRAELLKQQNRMGVAIQALDAAYEYKRDLEIRITQVAWLAAVGHFEGAQYYLDRAQEHRETRPWLNSLNKAKLDRLQVQLDTLKNSRKKTPLQP